MNYCWKKAFKSNYIFVSVFHRHHRLPGLHIGHPAYIIMIIIIIIILSLSSKSKALKIIVHIVSGSLIGFFDSVTIAKYNKCIKVKERNGYTELFYFKLSILLIYCILCFWFLNENKGSFIKKLLLNTFPQNFSLLLC